MSPQQKMIADLFTTMSNYEIIKASPRAQFPYWGTNGIRIFRNTQSLVNAVFESLGFREMKFPSICDKEKIEIQIKNKVSELIDIDLASNLVLAPFSDIQYLEFFQKSVKISDKFHKIFTWSETFRLLDRMDTFSYGQYQKFEAFALLRRETVKEFWSTLNELLINICKQQFSFHPISGCRPRKVVFPGSEVTFSIEMAVDFNFFQTVIVSHIMKDELLVSLGYSDIASQWQMIGICFNHNLLTNLFAHQMDEHGLVFSSQIAPNQGMIFNPPSDMEHHRRYHGIKFHTGPFSDSLIKKEGVLWGIVQRDEEWRVWLRSSNNFSDLRWSNVNDALDFACKHNLSHDRSIYIRSQTKTNEIMNASLMLGNKFRVSDIVDTSMRNIWITCCENCLDEIMSKSSWTPKLALSDEINCSQCHGSNGKQTLFECTPGWTGYYQQEQKNKF